MGTHILVSICAKSDRNFEGKHVVVVFNLSENGEEVTRVGVVSDLIWWEEDEIVRNYHIIHNFG